MRDGAGPPISEGIATPFTANIREAAPLLEASLGRRYLAKLTTNLVGLGLGFVNISVMPRALGPAGFGSFDFLTVFFQNASGLWDMGTSQALLTKLSRRNEDLGLLRFYFVYVLWTSLGLLAAAVVVGTLGLTERFWPDQGWLLVILAAIAGYVTWTSEVIRKVADAFGITVSSELVYLGVRSAGAVAVVVLFFAGWLDLRAVFIKEMVVYATIGLVLAWIAKRHWRRHLRARAVRTPIRIVRRAFWEYCSPLITYSLVGVVAGFADRWVLQVFAGSIEQGFFGLGARVAAVSFIFSVAMTQLLQREFSRAYAAANQAGMRHLFRRYVPLLYTVTAYFAVFASAETRPLVAFIGGADFAPAVPATMIMALYPIHQTYGQLGGAIFLATDRTALYRNIGVVGMVAGLAATWFVLAPGQWGGLGGGSESLAAKLVVTQFVMVNVQFWFNTRVLQLSFLQFLRHQIGVVATFLAIAWGAIGLVGLARWPDLVSFLASGCLYTAGVGAVLVRWPQLAGLSSSDVRRVAHRLGLGEGR